MSQRNGWLMEDNDTSKMGLHGMLPYLQGWFQKPQLDKLFPVIEWFICQSSASTFPIFQTPVFLQYKMSNPS